MTPGEFVLSMFVLALLFAGAWKLGELVVDWAHRFGQWRRDRARTAGTRLSLPGDRVVLLRGYRACDRRQAIRTIGGDA